MHNKAERKFKASLDMARYASRSTWQAPMAHRRKYAQIRDEAMQDARYWRQQLREDAS